MRNKENARKNPQGPFCPIPFISSSFSVGVWSNPYQINGINQNLDNGFDNYWPGGKWDIDPMVLMAQKNSGKNINYPRLCRLTYPLR